MIAPIRRQLAAGLAGLMILGPLSGPLQVARAAGALPPTSVTDALRKLQPTNDPTQGPATSEVGPSTWSTEQPLDPSAYRLLPGDLVLIGVWGESPKSWQLRVSPTGSIALPMAGPIDVARLSLEKAEAATKSAMNRFYPGDRVSLSLVEPGRFRVPITGMVGRPGIYEVSGLDRLSSALEAAGGVRPGGSLREIRLRHTLAPSFAARVSETASAAPGGLADDAESVESVDLTPWLLGGRLDANPMLEPGFSVEVPMQGETVRIRGPVYGRSSLETPVPSPTRIGDRPEEEADLVVEWRAGDTLGYLLSATGGITDRASGAGVLRRGEETPRALDLADAGTLALPLEPNDVVEVGYTSRWVFVTGAIRSPGRFPYLPGLRVADYVAMAGGPTEVGRTTGWTTRAPDGSAAKIEPLAAVAPGTVLRVPERRSYKLTQLLAPLSSATALIISIAALARR